MSSRNDPPNQYRKFKRLPVFFKVNTILPQNLVSFRPVVPYQIVTSLIAWSRFLPPSHVATKWISPHTMYFFLDFLFSYCQWVLRIFNPAGLKQKQPSQKNMVGRSSKKAPWSSKCLGPPHPQDSMVIGYATSLLLWLVWQLYCVFKVSSHRMNLHGPRLSGHVWTLRPCN